jgi:hypothetical protein
VPHSSPVWQRLILVVSSIVVLASWAICALSYATQGGGGYNGGLFAIFILVAAAFTAAAAALVVGAWRDQVSVLAAAPVSVVASASILWLAVAIGLRG